MEKHNVIEATRTPGLEKNANDGDDMFAEAVGVFDKDAMLMRGKSAAPALKFIPRPFGDEQLERRFTARCNAAGDMFTTPTTQG